MTGIRLFFVALIASAALPAAASDAPLRLAVASNFRQAAEELVQVFAARHSAEVTISAASTGKLYAQIINGAPFHVLLAADAERPARLEQTGLIVPGSRFTYALGQLALWSRDPAFDNGDCLAALRDSTRGRLALANPTIAPYGLAARQTLGNLDLWDALQNRLVFGENVSQSLQFAASGNARFGLIAAAQLSLEGLPKTGCRWDVPAEMHEPIQQQAVLLKRGARDPVAAEFMDFLASDKAAEIILGYGYRLESRK